MIATYWPSIEADIIRHIGAGELASFLEWSVVKAVMFVGPGHITDAEFIEMATLAPNDYGVGCIGRELNGYPNSNLFHQAYHLYQWSKQTGLHVRDLQSITEVGGGYGAMARVCRQLGFTGEYIIHDLPAMTDLQHYYLKQTDTRATLYTAPTDSPCDLLIALFSLSEMDADTQAYYLDTLTYNHFLVGIHNAPWHGVEVNHRLNSHFASGQRISHPHIDGRYYIIG